jgi:hypothetical protein
MELAPIILFVYNRPEHTRRTVEALKLNRLADKTELYVFSDGPKGKADYPGVLEVRDYLQSVTGFGRVHIKASAGNRGLAASIIDGVTEIVNKHGRVIVLEDDIVTSSLFLEYMNQALSHYDDIEQVMHVSGYWYPCENSELPESFFLRIPSPWGWGTWSRAWASFSKDALALQASLKRDDLYRFNLDGAHDFWEQVEHNIQGKANTWFIFWYASIFKQGGVCLYPAKSFSLNIGHDGTGVHCVTTEAYKVRLCEEPVRLFSDDYSESTEALSCIQEFHRRHCPSRFRRFLLILGQRLRKLPNWRT